MKFICLPRRSGRTTEMIKATVLHDGVMVCVNEARARVARDLAHRLYPAKPAEYWQDHIVAFTPHRACGTDTRWFVDDVDDLLASLLGKPVSATTFTADDNWSA